MLCQKPFLELTFCRQSNLHLFSARTGISKCESNIPQLFHIVEELFVRVHLRLMQAKGT